MLIWTRGYRPWILGGDVNAPVGIEIEVGEKLDLGKGFFGYVVTNPKTGDTHVVEAVSGALVGSDLNKVRADVQECDDIDQMKEQIEKHKKLKKQVEVLDPDKFWGMFK